jgi:glycerophosphoryl diester phosphodiesterase
MVVAHPYFDLDTPIVIGHRGCAGEVPENTLASFEAALDAGAAILESDVHLTRDGVPVLIHDDAVDRVSDGSGRVGELGLAELERPDAGHRFDPDGTGRHPFRGRGLRIPSLAEALAGFPAARFNLELKEDLPGIVEHTVTAVVSARAEARTLLTCAEDALMARLDRHLATVGAAVARGASTGDVLAFVRSALEGVAPPAGPMALQVPAEFGERPLVTREFVSHAHAHGLQVHVWTINDVDEMHRLFDLGADGIVTDFPARLARVVADRRGRR